VKIPDVIKRALAETGLPWALEPGKNHFKIRVNGRMAGILPMTKMDRGYSAARKTIAQIQRVARGEKS
jgi:hypothetical protein